MTFRVVYGFELRYVAVTIELADEITAVHYTDGLKLRDRWTQFVDEMVRQCTLDPNSTPDMVSFYSVQPIRQSWSVYTRPSQYTRAGQFIPDSASTPEVVSLHLTQPVRQSWSVCTLLHTL